MDATSGQPKVSEKQYNCKMCSLPDSAGNLVGCDTCEAWAHYQCAGVTDSIADPNRSWKCESCRASREKNKSQKSQAASSIHSRSSKRSARSELNLQMLQEQKELQLKALAREEAAIKESSKKEEELRKKRVRIEDEFIRKKYGSLNDFAEDGDSRRSRTSTRASSKKVVDWLPTVDPKVGLTEWELPRQPQLGRAKSYSTADEIGQRNVAPVVTFNEAHVASAEHQSESHIINSRITPVSASTPQTRKFPGIQVPLPIRTPKIEPNLYSNTEVGQQFCPFTEHQPTTQFSGAVEEMRLIQTNREPIMATLISGTAVG
ncbi:CXXC-type zinc finger protein 1-like [Uranotaenia lowii]|uniref:CXXC-type zinc finger protein 1-like n=1 Tax=Uranotaenia lowii TaxID=190385 RepID=UPI00247B2303|nr:CXXC-type zinc finger protein 1-like [Uranotaenia lowii]